MESLIDQCPLFQACFNEILRLTINATSARNVEALTKVGEKTLVPGAKILIPYRRLHHNPEVFGPNVDSFNPSRFLDNKDLHKSPSFKPFSGGITHCSGRFLAKRTVLALPAIILTQYELDLVDKEAGIPRFDVKKPTLGVMDPIGGKDILLSVRPRMF